jgi:hypothetical protein
MPIKTKDADGVLRYFDSTTDGASSATPAIPIVKPALEDVTNLAIDINDAAEHTLVSAPGAGYRIRIFSLELSSLENFELDVISGSTIIRTYLGASISEPQYPINLGENEALKIQAAEAVRIAGGLSYAVEVV